MKEKFQAAKVPAPLPSVAQVSIARNVGIAEISGLCVVDKHVKNYARSVGEQTRLIFTYLDTILKELGLTKEDIIKSNVFLRSMDDFPEMDKTYSDYFGVENPPARQTVAVGLCDGYDVEISFTAAMK